MLGKDVIASDKARPTLAPLTTQDGVGARCMPSVEPVGAIDLGALQLVIFGTMTAVAVGRMDLTQGLAHSPSVYCLHAVFVELGIGTPVDHCLCIDRQRCTQIRRKVASTHPCTEKWRGSSQLP